MEENILKTDKIWCVLELSEEDIRTVAKRNGYNLEGKDLDSIAKDVKDRVALAMDDVWKGIIAESLKDTRRPLTIYYQEDK